ncbi:MAG: sensor histidine kinase [Crenarchaeota archaeon]|nr:MAG: sensor histidine kinase [Thermoproteota archaeon]RDJ33888.1 MAG: sensor histidine kinase [Thermoproteota archaeon]RDJ37000.1 MAG: sensor histidine kinase [Thermoproteota archaeon]RDJ37465.1 MAG: sensor histidine kinase [Thermoproteota archaeon]
MLANNTKTSFKIGGMIGIMILLLGIAIMFGIYQMSKISQDIVTIAESYSPLQDTLSNIRNQKANQDSNIEKIFMYTLNGNEELANEAKEEFWFSSGVIDSEFSKAKKIIQAGQKTADTFESNLNFQVLDERIGEIKNDHILYDIEAGNTLSKITSLNSQEIESARVNLISQGQNIQKNLEVMSDEISFYVDNTTVQISQNESDALFGQVIIITIVGAIAGTLVLLLSRINSDLKKEVELKTLELKNANEKLQKLDRMKDEFIGIASHELKSPIQPIFGFAELARSGDIDQNEAWDGVTELAKKLQDLANDVLDVSRLESNRLILHLEKLRINDIILGVTKGFKLNQNEIEIKEKLDENIEISLDRVRIEQVLRNLLNNAMKFTSKGTIEITSHVNQEKDELQVLVSDSGKGIPQDILPNIFEKFVTKNLDSENQSGTGLGLFLCKGIIEAHGGKISARNKKDQGAEFEITIPIKQEIKQEIIPN